MRRIKKVTFILVFCFTQVYSQDSTNKKFDLSFSFKELFDLDNIKPPKKKPYKSFKAVVKVYPIDAIISDYRIGFEYFLREKFSLNFFSGYRRSMGFYLGDGYNPAPPLAWYAQGVGMCRLYAGGGFRVYSNSSESGHRIFIGVEAVYRYTNFKPFHVYIDETTTECPSKLVDPVEYKYFLNSVFGLRSTTRKSNLVFDFYGGLGIMDKVFYENILTPPQPGFYPVSFFINDPVRYPVQPHAYVGFSVGWGFKAKRDRTGGIK